jgi:hypothetical protein
LDVVVAFLHPTIAEKLQEDIRYDWQSTWIAILYSLLETLLRIRNLKVIEIVCQILAIFAVELAVPRLWPDRKQFLEFPPCENGRIDPTTLRCFDHALRALLHLQNINEGDVAILHAKTSIYALLTEIVGQVLSKRNRKVCAHWIEDRRQGLNDIYGPIEQQIVAIATEDLKGREPAVLPNAAVRCMTLLVSSATRPFVERCVAELEGDWQLCVDRAELRDCVHMRICLKAELISSFIESSSGSCRFLLDNCVILRFFHKQMQDRSAPVQRAFTCILAAVARMIRHMTHEFPKNRALELQVLRFLQDKKEKFMMRTNATNADWRHWIATMRGRLFGFLANLTQLQSVLQELGWTEVIQSGFTNFLTGFQMQVWVNPKYVETRSGLRYHLMLALRLSETELQFEPPLVAQVKTDRRVSSTKPQLADVTKFVTDLVTEMIKIVRPLQMPDPKWKPEDIEDARAQAQDLAKEAGLCLQLIWIHVAKWMNAVEQDVHIEDIMKQAAHFGKPPFTDLRRMYRMGAHDTILKKLADLGDRAK